MNLGENYSSSIIGDNLNASKGWNWMWFISGIVGDSEESNEQQSIEIYIDWKI